MGQFASAVLHARWGSSKDEAKIMGRLAKIMGGDAEKTQTGMGWHSGGILDFSFSLCGFSHGHQHGGFRVARFVTSQFWAPKVHVTRVKRM